MAGRWLDGEQVGLQEDLAVGDRDDVGRDVRRHVVGLGLDDRQPGHRAVAKVVGELGAALEQTAVQVEDVARVGLTTRRAAQQQRHGAVGLGLLGQVVEDDQDVLAVVHPVLADGRAGVGREVLEARRVRGRRRHDRGVLQRAGLLEGTAHGGDGRALLADGDVDAADLLVLVAGLPVLLLVDDRVDRDRGLAGRAVADDQLALAAADRGHRVDRLDAGRERLVHRLARHHARRLELQRAATLGLDVTEAVDRGAERVDHAAEELVADGDRQDLAGAAYGLALLDAGEVTEDDDTDLAGVEVQGNAQGAVLELEQLVGHGGGEAADPRDAVGGLGDRADLLLARGRRLVVLDVLVERVADLLRTNRKLRHLCASSLLLGCLLELLGCRSAGQPASLRWTSSSLLATVPSMTSSPISTRRPPTTSGSTTTCRCTDVAYCWDSAWPAGRARCRSGHERCAPSRSSPAWPRPRCAGTPRVHGRRCRGCHSPPGRPAAASPSGPCLRGAGRSSPRLSAVLRAGSESVERSSA